MFPLFNTVSRKVHRRTPTVSSLYLYCSLTVSLLYPHYSSVVSSLYLYCIPTVFLLHSHCIPTVSSLHADVYTLHPIIPSLYPIVPHCTLWSKSWKYCNGSFGNEINATQNNGFTIYLRNRVCGHAETAYMHNK